MDGISFKFSFNLVVYLIFIVGGFYHSVFINPYTICSTDNSIITTDFPERKWTEDLVEEAQWSSTSISGSRNWISALRTDSPPSQACSETKWWSVRWTPVPELTLDRVQVQVEPATITLGLSSTFLGFLWSRLIIIQWYDKNRADPLCLTMLTCKSRLFKTGRLQCHCQFQDGDYSITWMQLMGGLCSSLSP